MIGKSIGILGGTFNPIHNGHIKLAVEIMNRMRLSNVILVPSWISPHKISNENILPEHRMKMCELACRQHEGLFACDIEIKKKGVSYTYLTLELLHEQFPHALLYFIVGADMFLSMKTWKNYKRIFKLASICTVPRSIHDMAQLQNFAKILQCDGAKTFIENVYCSDISSTFIRQKLANKQDISGYVPKCVNEYILKKRLYMEEF